VAAADANFACLFAVNGATNGTGGDLKIDAFATDVKVDVRGLLSVGSWAASGGSIALSTVGSAIVTNSTFVNCSAGGRLLSAAEVSTGAVYNAQTDTYSTATWVEGKGGALLAVPSGVGRGGLSFASTLVSY